MSTTVIRTSSKNQFNKIQKYLKNRRVRFTSCVENQSFALTLFSLTSEETTRPSLRPHRSCSVVGKGGQVI